MNPRILVVIAAGLALLTSAPSTAATITGKVAVAGLRTNANAVVYIATAPGSFTPAPKIAPQVDQTHLSFEPHVLPVVVGTAVSFLNSDDVQHNVFTPSAAGDLFNLGSWPKGQKRTYTFSKMGRVDLLCNVHHEMHAYILVLQNPFFAVTDKDGNYRIDNVPAGAYQIKVWHEHAQAPGKSLNVSNGTVTANFELASR